MNWQNGVKTVADVIRKKIKFVHSFEVVFGDHRSWRVKEVEVEEGGWVGIPVLVLALGYEATDSSIFQPTNLWFLENREITSVVVLFFYLSLTI